MCSAITRKRIKKTSVKKIDLKKKPPRFIDGAPRGGWSRIKKIRLKFDGLFGERLK